MIQFTIPGSGLHAHLIYALHVAGLGWIQTGVLTKNVRYGYFFKGSRILASGLWEVSLVTSKPFL